MNNLCFVLGDDFGKRIMEIAQDVSLILPYKEETMEKIDNKAIFEGNAQSCDIMNDIIKNDMEEKGDKAMAPNLVGEDYSGKRFGYKIPQGYEFDCILNNKIIIKPIKPKYPKTYAECCEVLDFCGDYFLTTYETDCVVNKKEVYGILQQVNSLTRLLICKSAYWKIAGEEMGLGKPWEPYETKDRYIIRRVGDAIVKGYNISSVLEFPTVEMRDAFYENFKDLIDECKELL